MEGRSMDIIHPKYDPSMKEAPEKPKSEPKSTPTKKSPQTTNRGDNFWPMYLVGILVVAVIVFFGIRAASSLVDVWTDLSPSTINNSTADTAEDGEAADSATTETAETAPEATTEAPAEPAPTPATETPAETPAVAAAPAINKADLKVRVLNGNGVPGAAGTGKETLEAAGFTVDSTGNAKQFNYNSTIIYYPSGKAEQAQLVADALTDYSVTIEENSVADGYDALVVIGDK